MVIIDKRKEEWYNKKESTLRQECRFIKTYDTNKNDIIRLVHTFQLPLKCQWDRCLFLSVQRYVLRKNLASGWNLSSKHLTVNNKIFPHTTLDIISWWLFRVKKKMIIDVLNLWNIFPVSLNSAMWKRKETQKRRDSASSIMIDNRWRGWS